MSFFKIELDKEMGSITVFDALWTHLPTLRQELLTKHRYHKAFGKSTLFFRCPMSCLSGRVLCCEHCSFNFTVCEKCSYLKIKYCSKPCRIAARKEKSRLYSWRFQRTFRGKWLHAKRQKRYRKKSDSAWSTKIPEPIRKTLPSLQQCCCCGQVVELLQS